MSISLNSCKILGIDKAYGSIEKGKKATLFVSEGPALDMRTNNVIYSMMNGKWVDLGNRQEDLYKKYKSKYEESK
jgi:imidazolonepropionase-like amidohydrolase